MSCVSWPVTEKLIGNWVSCTSSVIPLTLFHLLHFLRNHSTVSRVEFPTCLASTLLELYLSNNDLKTVPYGISDMEKLTVLDLSE